MDDWGTSVWDTPADSTSPPNLTEGAFARDEDVSGDLGEMTDYISQKPFVNDDFGDDFGDFGDGDQIGFEDNDDMGVFPDEDAFQNFPPTPTATWEPLRLDPWPSPSDLAASIDSLLKTAWTFTSSTFLTNENIRQAEGPNQILVTPECRSLYHILFSEIPPAATMSPNWIRSRIRRQHLIALGIPINLDEIMPYSNGKSMPSISVTTRPSSAPPGPRDFSRPGSGPASRAGTPRPSTPQPAGSIVQQAQNKLSDLSTLGPKPVLDETKIAKVLQLDQASLALSPLSTLEANLNTLRSLTSDTSVLLAYLLQVREALQQDAETYNGLIASLVGEAQKLKSLGGKTRSGGKRGSALA